MSKTAETDAAGSFKVITSNRKAYHDYHIIERIEAGIQLVGTEVKALRAGRVNLKDSYAEVRADGQVFLVGTHINPYEAGNRFNHEPERPRRLLLHKREILKLGVKVRDKGMTVVPLRLYFKGSKCKVELGLVRGKRLYDKREAIAKREAKRDLDRALKESRR